MQEKPIFITALIQLPVGIDKHKNLENAEHNIERAAANGAKLVILPECFNSPYGVNFFREFAEDIPNGETSRLLSRCAKRFSIFIVGGTIPEVVNET